LRFEAKGFLSGKRKAESEGESEKEKAGGLKRMGCKMPYDLSVV
jgi:hypothetical protein